jgi:hypothetical protein
MFTEMCNVPVLLESLLLAGANPLASALALEYFAKNPEIADAFRRAKARLAFFEAAQSARHDAVLFFAAMQRALEAVEASLQPGDRPVYVAWTSVPAVVATNAFELRRDSVVSEIPALSARYGPFLGYLAVGEGGVAYFDVEGRWCGSGPRPHDVRTALAWPWTPSRP